MNITNLLALNVICVFNPRENLVYPDQKVNVVKKVSLDFLVFQDHLVHVGLQVKVLVEV
jgi:hypothetical protein